MPPLHLFWKRPPDALQQLHTHPNETFILSCTGKPSASAYRELPINFAATPVPLETPVTVSHLDSNFSVSHLFTSLIDIHHKDFCSIRLLDLHDTSVFLDALFDHNAFDQIISSICSQSPAHIIQHDHSHNNHRIK